jgi:hypothetical protein
MTARPRTLHDAVAIAPDVAPEADPFGAETSETKEIEVARRGVLVRVSPETWRALKIAAIERGLTVHALMLEGIEFVLNGPDETSAPSRPGGA